MKAVADHRFRAPPERGELLRKRRQVAIIGLGPMGRRYVEALRLVDSVELTAAADTRPKALSGAALNGIGFYTDALTMLAEIQADVVIVATNGPSHHSLVLAAIAAGAQSILCEKPLACSLLEAEEMIRTASEQGCKLAVNHGRRHVPAYRWLAQQLQSGQWGELRSIRSSCPGIGLGCIATHMIDLWRFLGGEELHTVFGWVDPVRGPNPRGAEFSDPGGMIVATSASGTRYVHEQTEDGAGPGALVIETTAAQIDVDEYNRSVSILQRDLSVKPGPGRPPKYNPVLLPADAPLLIDIVRLSADTLRELVGQSLPTCAAEHGLRSLEVVVAAHLSNDRGHAPIVLPLRDPESKAKWLPIT
jgi:predicted dehydrogenase